MSDGARKLDLGVDDESGDPYTQEFITDLLDAYDDMDENQEWAELGRYIARRFPKSFLMAYSELLKPKSKPKQEKNLWARKNNEYEDDDVPF